ncbi:MAG TPA: 16S rRNA (uracil(1498)-N(3))-methyltransferase [Gammaproteobacteria bacterium]|nr:16S rRNA (uracil(1498)-N(3))-methyltransferase [Gammaproteobacteria bacterium]
MGLPRIHQAATLREGLELTLDEGASRHLLRVLRLRPGDHLAVFDGEGREHEAVLVATPHKRARVALGAPRSAAAESPLEIVLAQGIARGERMDYALQKAVELGVSRIVPLFTRRSNVKLAGERLARRLAHWRGVVIHACEQCGRSRLPRLDAPVALADWQPPAGLRLVLAPQAQAGPATLAPPEGPVVLAIGPEGGLSKDEFQYLQGLGFHPLRLGPRILRTETAAVAALAALQTLWGDLS